MEIRKTMNGNQLTVQLDGRLDTVTSPILEKELDLNEVRELIFDLSGLQYISSAGLRVLLICQKQMNKQGRMAVKNVKPEILEIFEMTGFDGILSIE